MKTIALGLAVAALGLAGCEDVHVSFGHHQGGNWGQGGVKGSGKVTTETRKVDAFHAVSAGAAFKVNVSVGPDTSFKIEGEDNILPLVKSEVKDGTLNIYIDEKGIDTQKDITISLTTPKIDSLEASGACVMNAKGVAADHLKLGCSGASELTLNGSGKDTQLEVSGASRVNLNDFTADKISGELSGASSVKAQGSLTGVDLELSGASQVDFLKAVAKTAKLQLSGAASAKIAAAEGIDADLSGGSNLEYKGGQNVHIHTSGGSSSSQIN